jgi:rare lipoprotein A (peptidoglycan hydrolase)
MTYFLVEDDTMSKRIVVIGLLVLLVSVMVEAGTWYRHHGQVGWASWYGTPYHGRQTASGERFSMWQLTAAHRSLPLGTKALVTSLDTGQQVQVTINDRGPFVDPQRRIIDLSRAAAAHIGLVQRGVGRVHVAPIEKSRTPPKTPAAPAAASTSVTHPRLAAGGKAVKAAREVPGALRTAQRPAANRSGERSRGDSAPITLAATSWIDCRVGMASCLSGD